MTISKELHGKDTILKRSQELEMLLYEEKSKDHTTSNKQPNRLSTIPSIHRAAKADSHDTRKSSTQLKDRTQPIDVSNPFEEVRPRFRIPSRDEEDQDRTEDGEQDEVEIERPSPSRGTACESPADHWTEDESRSPAETCESDISRPFLVRGVYG